MVWKKHVPGSMDWWTGGWMGGGKSGFKGCLQQSKTSIPSNVKMKEKFNM